MQSLKNFLLRFQEALIVKFPSCGVLSFASAVIFYYPLLKNKCRDAGILFSGDTLGYYWPMIIKTHSLFADHKFSAIDFSLFNGSSEFFLNANFFYFHPLLVAYGLLVPFGESCIIYAGRFLVFLLFAHSFASVYYLTKLLKQKLGFCTLLSLLGGIFYTFSVYMINSLNQPPFLICATLTPWITYGTLKVIDSGRLDDLFFASLPVFICLLGGYLPLAAMCIAASLILSILINYNNGKCLDIFRITRLLLPCLIATLFLSPYIIAIYVFHQNTTSESVISLFYSAHQLADIPANFINILSNRLGLSTKTYEFTASLGLIPVWILAMWLFNTKEQNKNYSIKTGFISACLIIPVFLCLATFGDYSPLSDFFYYFVPILGKMHIYQRYYLPAFIFITISVLIGMSSVLESKNTYFKKIAFLLSLILLLFFSLANLNSYKVANININGYLVFEALCLFFFCLLILIGHKRTILAFGLFLIMLPRLDQFYDLALGGNTLEKASSRVPFSLNPQKRQEIKTILKSYFQNQPLRYADLTKFWSPQGIETFPKTFPYLLLNDIHLTSLGGFCFYLGCDSKYQSLVPHQADLAGDLAIPGNIQYYEKTNIDFIIGNSDSLVSFLGGIEEKNSISENLYLGIVSKKEADTSLDIKPEKLENEVRNVFQFKNQEDPRQYVNHATNSAIRQSSEGGGSAKNAIDGITDGSFFNGSVSHTAKQMYPYLELDLREVKKINEIEIWNRTDGASERLKDYIVIISESPLDDKENFKKLTYRPATFVAKGIMPLPVANIKMPEKCAGRFVRIQIVENDETWLSLAEVKVLEKNNTVITTDEKITIDYFSFDFASKICLDFQAPQMGVIEYQFFPNRNLKFILNGEKFNPLIENGIAKIQFPAGVNSISIVYNNFLMNSFIYCYFLYFGLMVFFMARSLLNAMT